MNKKVLWQKIIQCCAIVFLLFNIVYTMVTNSASSLSFILACVFGICEAVLVLLLLYTDKSK